jgi:hypothetical protein
MKMSLLLLLFPLLSFAQKKHDNTIIISHYIAPAKIKSILFSQGYTFTNTDTSFISTDYKRVGLLASLELNIMVTDSVIYIKGNTKTEQPDNISPTEYIKILGLVGTDWVEMKRIAELLSDTFAYTKE